MKLLHRSIIYLSVLLLLIMSIWAVIFYFNILDEIEDNMDDRLENHKERIVYSVQKDSSILTIDHLSQRLFTIHAISKEQASVSKDRYLDTSVYLQDIDDNELELEPVRMLVTAFESHGVYYELKIVHSKVEEDDLIEEVFWDIFWLYWILIVTIIVVDNLVLRKLWKPFYSFLSQLKQFKLGADKFPKVPTETKEFKDMQDAVNILLKHSTETYEQQKRFIGNASHEMQTPLAITTNKLELLIEQGNLTNTQAESIAEVMQVVEQLIRLNKSLLLLTKIENKQFFDNQPVTLNKIVQQSCDNLADISAFKKIKWSVNETHTLSVHMDKSLANILISNLIRNAVFHNIPNGIVQIDILKHSVSVSNTGDQEALDENKIFRRFYKSEFNQRGTGLGLSIVKAICELYGYALIYRFKDKDKLHSFELIFV